MALVVSVIFSLLYFATPNVEAAEVQVVHPRRLRRTRRLGRSPRPSSRFYVATFASYSKTYGSLAAVVVGLVWLWISNLAVLFGAELNAEMERGRELQAGMHEAERDHPAAAAGHDEDEGPARDRGGHDPLTGGAAVDWRTFIVSGSSTDRACRDGSCNDSVSIRAASAPTS